MHGLVPWHKSLTCEVVFLLLPPLVSEVPLKTPGSSLIFFSYFSHSSKGKRGCSTFLNKESSLSYKSFHSLVCESRCRWLWFKWQYFLSHCIWIDRWIHFRMDWVTRQVERFLSVCDNRVCVYRRWKFWT